MTTRRTTRRSIATGGITSNENDVVSTISSNTNLIQVNGKAVVGIKSGKISATNGIIGSKASTSTSNQSNVTRKRTAFNDVTNETKKVSSINPSKVPQGLKKPIAAVIPKAVIISARRTRSSTGGLDEDLRPIKDETSEVGEEQHEEQKEEEEEDVAMEEGEDGQQQNVAPAPAPARVFKSLRRSSNIKAAPVAVVAQQQQPSVVVTSKPLRRPLESKSTNSTITSQLSRPTHSTKAKAAATRPRVKSVPTAEAIRLTQRRLAAEAQIKAAQEELELAKKEEEAQQHKDKKARTSPSFGDFSEDVDVHDEDDEEEVEVEEEMELKVRPKDYGWEDLDDGDEEDPLMVSAYVVEVYDYLKELELTTMPDVDYMTNQNEVTWKMRGILIDWLVEIHTKFRLLPETIFLATNIVDRFLSSRIVSLVKFQLVGVTALFIASKYEEVVCPSVSNFLYMTDGGYEDDEILKAERYVLSTIDFNLSYPNPINFLRRISKADGYDISSRTMAKYLMEISIVDHKFMGITPSLIAAAGNWLARKVLGKGSWHANLVHYSGYTEEELKPTAQLMLDYVVRNSSLANGYARGAGVNPLQTVVAANEPEHPNFMKKYAGKKFFKASTMMKQWAEGEFAPIETMDPKTRKIISRTVPAIL